MDSHCRNIHNGYGLIWRQCTEQMKRRIDNYPYYKVMKQKRVVVALIKTIKVEIYRFETRRYKPDALNTAAANFYNCTQSTIAGE